MTGIEKNRANQIQKLEQISLADALSRYEDEYGTEAVTQYFDTIASGRSKVNEDEFDENALAIVQRSLKQNKLATKNQPEPAVKLELGARKNAVDPGIRERLAQRFDNNKTKVDALVATLEDDLAGADLKLYAKKLSGFRITVLKELVSTDRDLIEAAKQPIDDPLLADLVGNFEEDLLSLAMGA